MWQNGHSSLAAMAEYPNLSQQNIVSELMDNPVYFVDFDLGILPGCPQIYSYEKIIWKTKYNARPDLTVQWTTKNLIAKPNI